MASLIIFDFDDTLVKTSAQTYVTLHDEHGKEYHRYPIDLRTLTDFEQTHTQRLDLSEWESLGDDYVPNKSMVKLIKKKIATFGQGSVCILSARADPKPIHEFLQNMTIDPFIKVTALGSRNNPEWKASWIEDQISNRSLNYIEFYDDYDNNIEAVEMLGLKYPDITIKTFHIK